MKTPVVSLKNIFKSFNGITVLNDVDFELLNGEIHALMGGNGAGKSTLMKILEGVYTPDNGQIEINGQPTQIPDPQMAKSLGIGMVFQEFSLIPTLTVAQNIFLTNEPKSNLGFFSFINDREAERLAAELFADLGVSINPQAKVSQLSTGYWQLTEIAKALSQNARILILDEPTAALTVSETQSLFELIDRLKSKGISIIYISHRMEEVFQIADRITVLRDGHHVITSKAADMNMGTLVEHIVGRKIGQGYTWQEREVDRSQTPLLAVNRLRSGSRVQDVSFELHKGEILGVAGLMGSGRTELLQALFGIDHFDASELKLNGRPIKIRHTQDALRQGICLIPEDRRAQGLVLDHTVKENFLLPLLKNLNNIGIINDRRGESLADDFVDQLEIKTDSIHKIVRLLSGGNQQKVVIAKWLASDPAILLMDEPTAGVDIGAKTEILDVIRNLAEAGKGIIVVSSEFTELLAVADRILIMRNGKVWQEVLHQDIESEKHLEQLVQGVAVGL